MCTFVSVLLQKNKQLTWSTFQFIDQTTHTRAQKETPKESKRNKPTVAKADASLSRLSVGKNSTSNPIYVDVLGEGLWSCCEGCGCGRVSFQIRG